ncbi:MAG: family 78 glycoside hydrolase catalytic domain [Sedimentisphaerales bacterium]|nr:family 78 glycoside hydrolase catalytic domain [Sedimentisphaerales bacterium]
MSKISIQILFSFLIGIITIDRSLARNIEPSVYGNLTADYLRCEYRVDPLGIDEVRPRLSWIVESKQRGQAQRAYRVLVASSWENLEADRGDLWDSGKVETDETIGIIYEGKELLSHMRCFWKVCIWDKDSKPSVWSRPAQWSMGFLEKSDWQAQWIGYNPPETQDQVQNILNESNWIWYPEGNPTEYTSTGKRFFRRIVTLTPDKTISRAKCIISADDRFELFINGKLVGKGNNWNMATIFDVKDFLKYPDNVIAVMVENVGDSENPAGLIVSIDIEFTSGDHFKPITDEQWLVSNEGKVRWRDTDFDHSDWPQAQVLGRYGIEPWGEIKDASVVLPPARYLRREFTLKKSVHRAMLYATALGIYELRINGEKAGRDYFTPGWTDYNQRIYYNTYDVTDMLRPDGNAVGAVLADGWYAGYVGYGRERNHYGRELRLLGQLRLEYTDGSIETVATDDTWKASLGPLRQADFLMGEVYDATREMPGWDLPGFDASGWEPVVVGADTGAKIQAAPHGPVREMAVIKPVSVAEPVKGVYVLDMGQNFAGVIRFGFKGNKGQKIIIRYAERLNPDGTIYTENLRSARATDTYICKDDSEVIWQPRFTFHGFQYVEVTGLNVRPDLETISGIALSSDTPVVGSFSCSDEMINKLYSNIVWTQRMNFIDIPTDCPQRDERMGWTGDAQIYIRTACMNTDVQAFFTKWLVDLYDAQREDGQLPMVAPLKVAGDDGGPAWADAGIICPWTIYQIYGDQRILEKHYNGMKRFIDFCRSRSTAELLPPDEFHCFGDWLNIDADTPSEVIYTAYFAYAAKLMAQTAQVLGKTEDAEKYKELFERIRTAFNRAYVGEEGEIKGETQCGYVLALAFELLDPEKQDLAARRLAADIDSRDGHLSTGFVGTKDLMLVLSKIGRNDVAYRLLHNTTFPSWGFSIEQGATSIWERWNGWTPEDGFADPNMNSFAHYSFGAVGQWMFENIGGIDTDGPGFKRIIIRSRPGGKIRAATTRYNSIHGMISTDWNLEHNKFTLDVTIPANTNATVYIPTDDPESVTESELPAGKAQGVHFLMMEDHAAVYEIESGNYFFSSKLKL